MAAPEGGGSSEDGAEELLLPEGVLGGRHGDDEGVLADVRVTVRHQVGGRFGHLGRSRERSADKVVGSHNRGSRCVSGTQGKRRTEPPSEEKSVISRLAFQCYSPKEVY